MRQLILCLKISSTVILVSTWSDPISLKVAFKKILRKVTMALFQYRRQRTLLKSHRLYEFTWDCHMISIEVTSIEKSKE